MIDALVSPAPFLETAALFRRYVGLKPRGRALVSLQIAHADTIGFLDGDRLIAVMGLYPLDDGCFEVFTVGRDPVEVAPHILRIVRLARLMLARRLHSGTMAIIGFVRVGHEPGRRLARLAGFRPRPDDGAPSGFERWELRRDDGNGTGAVRRR